MGITPINGPAGPGIRINNANGWRDMKPHCTAQFHIDRPALAAMDIALPIVEREFYRENRTNTTPDSGERVVITLDTFAFHKRTEMSISPFTIGFSDGSPSINFLRVHYSNPVPELVSEKFFLESMNETRHSFGRVIAMTEEHRSIKGPHSGLFGYYMFNEGDLWFAGGLIKGLDTDETGNDMWQRMWEVHPLTGVHTSLFFEYHPTIPS